MERLLSRDEFRESVFKRDAHTCVFCTNHAVDAHHILDRKLFEDGGYYISNGASLCSEHHIDAEKSILTVQQIRDAAKITKLILPPSLLPNVVYDKWGNAEDYNAKYPRSLHCPISLGTTSDDRFIPKGYGQVFAKKNLILSEKLDGQNVSFNKVGVYARSHAAPTEHAWDKTMVQLWHTIKDDLGDLELFGESMYAIHSIEYTKLESHFYLFGVRQNGIWLSWDDVKMWAELFGFPTVPQIEITTSLSDLRYHGKNDKNLDKLINEDEWLRTWLHLNLGMDWEDYVNTGGALGGIDPETGLPVCEGFVIRHANAFKVNENLLPVAENEFDSLMKLVRQKHVKTDIHWTKNWKKAKLKWEYE